MRLSVLIICIILISFNLKGQENDTIVLNPVLITGQIIPTKINESIYAVDIISREQIKQSAANTLADLLNQSLNIQIIPNNETGKSGISMFGLNGEYVKVLVDNIPLINDEGFGSMTDFSQINLDNIEQIEIVEGSMGVEYGSDAVAGVINIITKKDRRKLNAHLYVQEESVGDEYQLKGRGRHIKGLNVSGSIAQALTGTLSLNENKFEGWLNDKKGKKYFEIPALRGHDFRPKTQYDAKASLNYKLGGGNIFYTFNYYHEEIDKYNTKIEMGENPIFDLKNPTVQDQRFMSERWRHHLNFYKTFWKDAQINISASYQSQNKDAEDYTYHIIQDKETDNNQYTYESRKVYYGKTLLGKAIIPHIWQVQLGAEINSIKGIQSDKARNIDNSNKNIERELGSYDVFTSSEIHVSDQWTVRPGIRTQFSSRFPTQLSYSLSTSYHLNPNVEIRAMYGSAAKQPTYEQLYTYFVDSNHYIVGNENLDPERSQSLFVHLFYQNKSTAHIQFKAKLSGWHLAVKDQIDLIITKQHPLEYEYKNTDTYTNRGVSLSGQIILNHFSAQLGVNYAGESYENNQSDMLYSWKANLGLNYYIPQYELAISTNLKRNGKEYQWQQDQTNPEKLVQGEREAYTWWDMSIKKDFLQDWQIVVGARNLLDVKEIENTTASANAHQPAVITETFAYGRSYFAKLIYTIPFK